MADQPSVQDKPFRLEEATIDELHQVSLLKTPKAKKSWSFSGIQSFE